MTAGKLTVGADGRLAGPARIEHNDPWPCVNGSWGSGQMTGVLMHTMVGELPGTVAWFNNPQAQASAHFGVAEDGTIHQFGPIGKGWIAWHAEAANEAWYGIEHADGGNPDTPLTDAQITASAQLVECLSAFAGFPLQVSDSPSVKGYGTHSMGGAACGGHSCPDEPPSHVRSAQRAEIIARAAAIREGAPPPEWTYSAPRDLQVRAGRHSFHATWAVPAGSPEPPAAYMLWVYKGNVCDQGTLVVTYPRIEWDTSTVPDPGGLVPSTVYTLHVAAMGSSGAHMKPGVYASATFTTAHALM